MADFCRSCATEMFGDHPGFTPDDNDLFDPQQRPGWRWWVCEGCGWHRFDAIGQRLCTDPPDGLPRIERVPEIVSLDPCTACCFVGGLLVDPAEGG